VEIQLSRTERERFQRYADANGISLEEAVQQAASAEIHRRYRLPKSPGRVVNLQALNRGRKKP
jgi:hypothetical protein